VVLELARILSAARQPEATIVFAAVAGEEQGLFGSAFMAAQMKAAGTDIQGMISNDIVGSSTADDGTGTSTWSGSSPRASRPRRRRSRPRSAKPSEAKTTGRRGSWPGSSAKFLTTGPPAWTSGRSTGATATFVPAIRSRS
jgi:hypothetical protein